MSCGCTQIHMHDQQNAIAEQAQLNELKIRRARRQTSGCVFEFLSIHARTLSSLSEADKVFETDSEFLSCIDVDAAENQPDTIRCVTRCLLTTIVIISMMSTLH